MSLEKSSHSPESASEEEKALNELLTTVNDLLEKQFTEEDLNKAKTNCSPLALNRLEEISVDELSHVVFGSHNNLQTLTNVKMLLMKKLGIQGGTKAM